MRVKRGAAGVVAVGLVLALAGCAGSDSDGSATETQTETQTQTATAPPATAANSATAQEASDSLGETCAAASAALSDIQSADVGWAYGRIDATVWAKHMTEGTEKMVALASGGNPGAEDEIAALAAAFGTIPDTPPQVDVFAGTAATEAASHALNEVCMANGTELVITMTYSGPPAS